MMLRSGDKKQYVSAFSLVCRYWACLCRRRLFDHITLRTRDDAKRFQEILDTPTLPGLEPIAGITSYLSVTFDGRDEPWLHLVFLLYLSKVPKCHLRLRSVEPLQSAGTPWHTLHPSLPRSIPGSLMQIRELCLHGLHFPSGRVLSRLMSSIPLLGQVGAFSLTFDTKPAPEDFSSIRSCKMIYGAETDDHQLYKSLWQPCVTNVRVKESAPQDRGRRRTQSILNEDDVKILWDLLSVFDTASGFRFRKAPSGESSILRGKRVQTPFLVNLTHISRARNRIFWRSFEQRPSVALAWSLASGVALQILRPHTPMAGRRSATAISATPDSRSYYPAHPFKESTSLLRRVTLGAPCGDSAQVSWLAVCQA